MAVWSLFPPKGRDDAYRDTVARGLFLVTLAPGLVLVAILSSPFWLLGKLFPWPRKS